jgi:Flp pilus assembly protein TadB
MLPVAGADRVIGSRPNRVVRPGQPRRFLARDLRKPNRVETPVQSGRAQEGFMLLILIIIILILLLGGGGYGYRRWGTGGGLGIVGTVLIIVLILWLLGVLRF